MAEQQGAPKLHIDSDWKAEAQREKERLAQKEKQKPQPAGRSATPAGAGVPDSGEPEPLPEASFRTLMGMLASQAIMGLGAMGDRETGRVVIDLESARFAIDLLDVLEQKTKGNLAADETKELTQLLAELRGRFVQISQLVAKQMAQQSAAGVVNPASGHGSGAMGVPPLVS